jgi:excinuclease ABC subunit C
MMRKKREGITINLKEKVKSLPSTPGVYLMKDSHGSIIYVGKAKNLKKRVQTYFQNTKSHSSKVERLVKHIRDFDYIRTDTEFEAFLKECSLIQELKPHYNSKMKNPLAYSYIEIQMDQEYQRIIVTSEPNKGENTLYLGPYASKGTLERALDGIKQYFKISCPYPKKNSACLNFSLGLCIGMCQGGSAIKQYNDIVTKITALLLGTDQSILEELEQRMVIASEQFDFETAAKYRDLIELIHYLLNRKKVIEFTEANQNILVIEPLHAGKIKLFLIKGNKVLFQEKLTLHGSTIDLISKIKSYIPSYFGTNEHNPSIQINRFEIDQAQIIYGYLKGSNCSFITIPEHWLKMENHVQIDLAIHELLNAYREMPSNV